MRNVCVVGPSKKFLSGISYHSIRLANGLSEENNVGVVCFRNLLPVKLFPGSKHVGKQLTHLDFNKNISVFDGMDYNSPRSWTAASKFLIKLKPEVIVLQWWSSTVAHLHLILKIINNNKLKSKLVLEMHEIIDPMENQIFPIKMYSRIAGKILKRDMDAYVVHSHADIDALSKTYDINKDKIHVIPIGLYDHYLPPLDKGKAKKQLGIKEDYAILNFGLIRKYKGVHRLVEAFGLLPEAIAKKVRLLIVGEIWDQDLEIEKMIKNNRYSENITFHNEYIPDEDVKLYFSAADALALPYLRSSGSGISMIGMAFSLPIIVSKIGALAENLANYDGTFFVPPDKPEELAQALEQVITNNRKIIQTPGMTWSEIASKYNELFETLNQ
jgi:glycosyltransferase involved in cell wall biosynthesis